MVTNGNMAHRGRVPVRSLVLLFVASCLVLSPGLPPVSASRQLKSRIDGIDNKDLILNNMKATRQLLRDYYDTEKHDNEINDYALNGEKASEDDYDYEGDNTSRAGNKTPVKQAQLKDYDYEDGDYEEVAKKAAANNKAKKSTQEEDYDYDYQSEDEEKKITKQMVTKSADNDYDHEENTGQKEDSNEDYDYQEENDYRKEAELNGGKTEAKPVNNKAEDEEYVYDREGETKAQKEVQTAAKEKKNAEAKKIGEKKKTTKDDYEDSSINNSVKEVNTGVKKITDEDYDYDYDEGEKTDQGHTVQQTAITASQQDALHSSNDNYELKDGHTVQQTAITADQQAEINKGKQDGGAILFDDYEESEPGHTISQDAFTADMHKTMYEPAVVPHPQTIEEMLEQQVEATAAEKYESTEQKLPRFEETVQEREKTVKQPEKNLPQGEEKPHSTEAVKEDSIPVKSEQQVTKELPKTDLSWTESESTLESTTKKGGDRSSWSSGTVTLIVIAAFVAFGAFYYVRSTRGTSRYNAGISGVHTTKFPEYAPVSPNVEQSQMESAIPTPAKEWRQDTNWEDVKSNKW